MTEEEKKTLIDAVNCKYPHQNLTEIYWLSLKTWGN